MTIPRLFSGLAGISIALAGIWPAAARASTAPPAADSAAREPSAERRVVPRAPRAESSDQALTATPAANASAAVPEVFEHQIHTRFTLLNDCPAEVARHQRISPSAFKGRKLTLRWTILPNGRVADTAVVATSRVDLRVMDCVKRQMSLWSFSHPDGGPLRVERPFIFRTR
jgi:hypothetical protein